MPQGTRHSSQFPEEEEGGGGKNYFSSTCSVPERRVEDRPPETAWVGRSMGPSAKELGRFSFQIAFRRGLPPQEEEIPSKP